MRETPSVPVTSPVQNASRSAPIGVTAPAAMMATGSVFTDSPRLRLRLARPRSQTRLAFGCGSHGHVHRLASPSAAAPPATFTDSPRPRLRLAPPPLQNRPPLPVGRGL